MERRGSRRVKLENRQLSLFSLTAESPVGCLLEHFSVPLSIKLSTSSIATFSTFCSYSRRLVWSLIPVVLPLSSLHRKPSTVVFSTYAQICTFHIQEHNSSYDINTPGCVGSITSFEKLSKLLTNHWSALLLIPLCTCTRMIFFLLYLPFQRRCSHLRDQIPHHLISFIRMDFPNGPPESCCLWEPPKEHGKNMLFLFPSPSLFVSLMTGLLQRDAISHLVEPFHLW